MSGVTGGRWVKRTTARNEAPTQSRKRSATATPRAYGTAPALDPRDSAGPRGILGFRWVSRPALGFLPSPSICCAAGCKRDIVRSPRGGRRGCVASA
jgi:hypothetical protein